MGDIYQVVANKRLRVFRVWVFDEWADTGPGGENIAATDIDVGGEVAADFVKNPVYFFFAGDRMRSDGCGCVCSASNCVTLPGEEENDTTVGGARIDQTL